MALATSLSNAEAVPPGVLRRWLPRSLRMRITLLVTAAMLMLILGQALALVTLYEEMEQDFIDQILDQQLSYSIARSRDAPALVLPLTPTMTLHRLLPGESLPADLPAAHAALPVGNHELLDGEVEYHVAVREADGARFILRYDETVHAARERVVSTAVLVGAVTLAVLVAILVYAISGRLTRGMERLAGQLADGSGDGPLAQPDMEQELLIVATALDEANLRQQTLLARERDFSAHLSHELRTPLSAIRSDAEMLALNRDLPESAHRRAARIVATTDRITELAHRLLLLAREMDVRMKEPIRLADAVRCAWQTLGPSCGEVEQAPAIAIPEAATVAGDPALLQRVLGNLLDNALRHGEGREIEARMSGARLLVCDRGPGFGGADPMQIFERFHHAGDKSGHGLGLALARHICTACGWEMFASNRPGGGAIVGIDFGSSLG